MFARSTLKRCYGATVTLVSTTALGICLYNNKQNAWNASKNTKTRYDVAVIGGGIVGLAVARELACRGKSIVLLEKEDAFAPGASSGNSGLGCTGYDAPINSLERRLLRRSIQLHQHIYRSFGLSHEHVRKCGSLVVAWTPEQLAMLPDVLEENREAGDSDAVLLSREELLEFEPGISDCALGAVYCPYEAIVEPWLVPIGYAESARLNGAHLRNNQLVQSAEFDSKNKFWKLTVRETHEKSSGRSEKGKLLVNIPIEFVNKYASKMKCQEFEANVVINCAGLYGDKVEKLRDPDDNGFTVTPRKGQFVVFKPRKQGPTAIIEPVATQFTKGVIAWTTVYGNIIVGPTAVDQESRFDRSTDSKTIQELRNWGSKIIPAVRDAEVVGTYSGLRPATEHRDYQICYRKGQNWITVGGIRSTGLTASSGIGEYVANLYESATNDTTPHLEKHLLGVSKAAESPVPLPKHIIKTKEKVPTLQELAKDFQTNNDGTVKVYGKRHRVTHPISSFGMETA